MSLIKTRLAKWMLMVCGWGPSDCQKRPVSSLRSSAMPQPGLAVETVQEARLPISLRWVRECEGEVVVVEVVRRESSVRGKGVSGSYLSCWGKCGGSSRQAGRPAPSASVSRSSSNSS